MNSLLGITNFLRTVRAGSFAGAARELGISAVAVSKNVATLERELGIRLLNRSTRALGLTEEGRLFHEQCDKPLQAIETACASAKQASESPTGLLRVTCLSPIGRGLVIPLMHKFCLRNPYITIDLRMEDKVSDMVAEGFDVGIRVGNIEDPEIVARKISNLPFVVCASPNYLSARGVPQTISDLAKHNCLRLGSQNTNNKEMTKASGGGLNWFLGPTRSPVTPSVTGNFISSDFNALEQAALNAMGLFHAPLPLVLPHFKTGLLKPVLPMATSSQLSLYLHYRSRRNQPARMRIFIEYLLENLRNHPDLAEDPISLCAPYWAPATQ